MDGRDQMPVTTIHTIILTLYAQLKAHMAEGKCSRVRLQLTDAADVVIVQVYVYKVLLFFHAGSAKQTEEKPIGYVSL